MNVILFSLLVLLAFGLMTSDVYAENVVPEWVKNTAGWWATDAISETEFVNAIEFLIKTGIINIKTNLDCVSEFKEVFPNESDSRIKDLCNNSEPNNELITFQDNFKINSYGLRGQEFPLTKSTDVYRIVLVGGSTMLGAGSYSDETTISGILQKIFDKQESETSVEIINAGISGATTITESKLINERITDFEPDLVIMYDGWNDLRSQYDPETPYNSWRSTCELGNQNGFDVVIALQPIPGFGNKDLTQQEHVNSLTGKNHNQVEILLFKSEYDSYANKLKELSAICTATMDLRNVFDGVDGSIFWDHGHTGEAGNMIIAEKLYEISKSITQNSDLKDHNVFNKILKKYNSPTVILYLLEKYDVDTENFKNTGIQDSKTKYFELKQRFGVENILVGKDLSDFDLSTVNLVDQDLTGASLAGQDLRNIDFTGTVLRSVDFTNANLSGLDLIQKELVGSTFNGTNLHQTEFDGAFFKHCKMSNIDFSNSSLAGVNFGYCTIVNSDFSNSKLDSVIFVHADISNTDFSNSDLSFDKNQGIIKTFSWDEIGMSPAEINKLGYGEIVQLVNKKIWSHTGQNPHMLLTSIKSQEDSLTVYFHIITNFGDARLHDVNLSNTDLTLAYFGGTYGEASSDDNTVLDCVGGHDTQEFSTAMDFCNDWMWFGALDQNLVDYGIHELAFFDSSACDGSLSCITFHTNDELRILLE